jgi:hypothetical protein
MVFRKLLLALTLVLAAGACNDSSGPDTVDGRYDLVTVNGAAAPQTVFTGTAGESIELTDAHLVLQAGGTVLLGLDTRNLVNGAQVGAPHIDSFNGGYTLDGDDLSFSALRGPTRLSVSVQRLSTNEIFVSVDVPTETDAYTLDLLFRR